MDRTQHVSLHYTLFYCVSVTYACIVTLVALWDHMTEQKEVSQFIVLIYFRSQNLSVSLDSDISKKGLRNKHAILLMPCFIISANA